MYRYYAKRISRKGIPTYGDIDIIISCKNPLPYNFIYRSANGDAYIVYMEADNV